jgi:cyclic lactone autoinducer peptide
MKRLLSLLAALITLVAFANVAAATGPVGYQPELPKSLKK